MSRRTASPTRPVTLPLDPIGVGWDAIGVDDVDAGDDRWGVASVWLVRRFLTLCEAPRTRDRALRLVRAGSAGGRRGRAVYGLVNRVVVNPVARACGVEASALKVELVVAQLVGLATMRYVLEVEPMASADVEELVRRTAPGIRAILAG